MQDDPRPFKVDRWSEDTITVVERLAEASSLSIGRAAFDIGAVSFPGSLLTLRGPGVFETHLPRERPGPIEPRHERRVRRKPRHALGRR